MKVFICKGFHLCTDFLTLNTAEIMNTNAFFTAARLGFESWTKQSL